MAEDVKSQMERLQNAVKEGGRRLQELLLRAEQLDGAIQAARSQSGSISESRLKMVARRNAILEKNQSDTSGRLRRRAPDVHAPKYSFNS